MSDNNYDTTKLKAAKPPTLSRRVAILEEKITRLSWIITQNDITSIKHDYDKAKYETNAEKQEQAEEMAQITLLGIAAIWVVFVALGYFFLTGG